MYSKNEDSSFIVCPILFVNDSLWAKEYKNLTLEKFLSYFADGAFPSEGYLGLLECTSISCQIYSAEDIFDKLYTNENKNYYQKSKSACKLLPDCISRYVLEINLSKQKTQTMLSKKSKSSLKKLYTHIISAREDTLKRGEAHWVTGKTKIISHEDDFDNDFTYKK